MIHDGRPAISILAQAEGFSLWPESASTSAVAIDRVYLGLIGLTLFFVVLIGALALGYGVKYRAGTTPYRVGPIRRTLPMELTWIVAPLVMTLLVFVWGAYVFVDAGTPPADARTIYVVGKQWMWKVQHPSGRREINELHVPAGEPTKLILTSQDVIHSFYVPAFRLKRDALPGTYTSLWFNATKPGAYHLFCAEYCGAEHARMRGRVVVMQPADFQRWLAEGESTNPPTTAPADLASQRGESNGLARFGCNNCHHSDSTMQGPRLEGLYGRMVRLRDGQSVTADENYIRRSILEPNDGITEGYAAPSTMPAYAGQISEEEMIDLVESIKSLKDDEREVGR